MADAQRATIAVLGQRGLIKDVIAQTVHARGYSVVTASDLENGGKADVAILLDPRSDDWDAASALGTPIIVMLDTEVSEQEAIDVLLAGADAVISTNDDHVAVGRAVDTVASGGVLLPRALAEALLRRVRQSGARPHIELTRREREILESIASGDAIKQTARKLGITVKTVQNLQSRLFRKLDARNRAQTITRAHELGLLD